VDISSLREITSACGASARWSSIEHRGRADAGDPSSDQPMARPPAAFEGGADRPEAGAVPDEVEALASFPDAETRSRSVAVAMALVAR